MNKPVNLALLTKPLLIRFTGGKVTMPVDVAERIEAHWSQLSANNPHLFNGDSFTITAYRDTPNSIEIELAETNYAHNLYSEVHDAGKYNFKVIHSACLVITSDNKFVLGEMGQNTARAGQVCCSGGSIDRGDIRGNTIDLKYSTTHELQEELGINVHDKHTRHFAPTYIKTGGPLDKITVLYELHTDLDSTVFAQQYQTFTKVLARSKKQIEFDQIFFVDNTTEKIGAFLAEHEGHLDEYVSLLLHAVNKRVSPAFEP